MVGPHDRREDAVAARITNDVLTALEPLRPFLAATPAVEDAVAETMERLVRALTHSDAAEIERLLPEDGCLCSACRRLIEIEGRRLAAAREIAKHALDARTPR